MPFFSTLLIIFIFLIENQSYSKPRETLPQWTQKKHFAFAYYYHKKRIPNFKRIINKNYLKMFDRFYVVYYQSNRVVAFDVVEKGYLFSRNIVLNKYVKSIRYDRINRRKIFSYLYYDRKNRLIKEESYLNGKNISTIVYRYDKNGKSIRNNNAHNSGSIEDYDDEGYYYEAPNEIPSQDSITYFPYDLGLESEAYQAMTYEWPNIKLKKIKIVKDELYSTYRIEAEIFNFDEKYFENLSISVDLYDKNDNLLDSLIGKPKSGNAILFPEKSMVLESSETRERFSRVRLYIHYNISDNVNPKTMGPLYFSKKK